MHIETEKLAAKKLDSIIYKIDKVASDFEEKGYTDLSTMLDMVSHEILAGIEPSESNPPIGLKGASNVLLWQDMMKTYGDEIKKYPDTRTRWAAALAILVNVAKRKAIPIPIPELVNIVNPKAEIVTVVLELDQEAKKFSSKVITFVKSQFHAIPYRNLKKQPANCGFEKKNKLYYFGYYLCLEIPRGKEVPVQDVGSDLREALMQKFRMKSTEFDGALYKLTGERDENYSYITFTGEGEAAQVWLTMYFYYYFTEDQVKAMYDYMYGVGKSTRLTNVNTLTRAIQRVLNTWIKRGIE